MRSDARLTALLTAVGAVAVGAAVQVADGYGKPAAFVWLTVAVAAVLLAVVLPTHRTIEAVLTRALPPMLVVVLAWQLWAMLQRSPARPFDARAGLAAVVPGRRGGRRGRGAARSRPGAGSSGTPASSPCSRRTWRWVSGRSGPSRHRRR